jgi:hypothetical protein
LFVDFASRGLDDYERTTHPSSYEKCDSYPIELSDSELDSVDDMALA